MMNQVLAIDPEFEAKCPPLTEEEFLQLEENILSEGAVLMPLIIWNNTIIDGHNRYKIAMANPGISFRTHEKAFDSRYEALAWICKNQLGRRNLTPQQKKYLIGERYDAEKQIADFHGNQYTLPDESGGDKSCHHHSDEREKTRKRIAKETGVSEGTVQNAYNYAKGVNAAEEVLPGIKSELLFGTIKPRDSDVAAIARSAPAERLEKAQELRKPRVITPPTDKQPIKHRRQDYQEIDEIYSDMKDQDKTVDEDDILETMQAAVKTMIRVCNTLFNDFPRLLTDQPYKDKVIEIMQEPKTYIQNLEGVAK